MLRPILFTALSIIGLVLGAALWQCRSGCAELEHRTGGSPPRVAATVPLTLAAVQAKLEHTAREPAAWGDFGRFTWVRSSDNAFPDDFQLRAFSSRDPALREYLSRPVPQRKWGFYLRQDSELYWASEYHCAGEPVKFRSNFILDLSSASPSSTRIEVLEYQPTVLVGRKFAVTAHGGPGFYDDIRQVEPTTSDRVEVLRHVLTVLRDP